MGFLFQTHNDSLAHGISSDGATIVGYSQCLDIGGILGCAAAQAPPKQAFRWVNGTMTGLGFLPGGSSSDALAANSDGTAIVGQSQTSTAPSEAFRWVNGSMTALGFLSGDDSSGAFGVNADGTVVVGRSYLANANFKAFRWTPKDGMRSIQALLTAAGVNLTGWTLQNGNSVSADGQTIVGFGTDPLGHTQGWIAKLPLPLTTTTESHDFNRDGQSDVLWYNTISGQVVTWLVNGTSVVGGGSLGSVASPWAIVGQRDFNGDGFADILWRNGTTGQLLIWFLNGSSVIGGGSPGSAPSPWTVVGTGDFNADGFGDVLWRNGTTGQLLIWFLNGSSVIGGGSPGSAASPWTVAASGISTATGRATSSGTTR